MGFWIATDKKGQPAARANYPGLFWATNSLCLHGMNNAQVIDVFSAHFCSKLDSQ